MQDFVEAAIDGTCNGDPFDLAAKTVDPRRACAYPVSPDLPAVEPKIEVPEIEPRIAANLPQRRQRTRQADRQILETETAVQTVQLCRRFSLLDEGKAKAGVEPGYSPAVDILADPPFGAAADPGGP